MDVGQYRHVLAIRDTRNALALGLLIRIPMFAGTVLLTLHVVTALGRSYGQAGLVTAAATVAIAISGPWRGRLLDRLGLRRTVAPSLLIQLVCWSIAPWVDYAPLMALAALAGLFVVPTFSILRQVIIRSVPEHQRRTALSLDSAATELSFMAGPALGVWLATTWDTGWALFTVEMAAVARRVRPLGRQPGDQGRPRRRPAAAARGEVWRADAVSGARQRRAEPVPGAWRGFITVRVAAVYLAAACSTLVLSGTDVAIVAALRSFDATAVDRLDPRALGCRARSSAASSTARGTAPSPSSGCSAVSPPRRRRSPSPSACRASPCSSRCPASSAPRPSRRPSSS